MGRLICWCFQAYLGATDNSSLSLACIAQPLSHRFVRGQGGRPRADAAQRSTSGSWLMRPRREMLDEALIDKDGAVGRDDVGLARATHHSAPALYVEVVEHQRDREPAVHAGDREPDAGALLQLGERYRRERSQPDGELWADPLLDQVHQVPVQYGEDVPACGVARVVLEQSDESVVPGGGGDVPSGAPFGGGEGSGRAQRQ